MARKPKKPKDVWFGHKGPRWWRNLFRPCVSKAQREANKKMAKDVNAVTAQTRTLTSASSTLEKTVAGRLASNARFRHAAQEALTELEIDRTRAQKVMQLYNTLGNFSAAAAPRGFCTAESMQSCINFIAQKERDFVARKLPAEQGQAVAFLIGAVPQMRAALASHAVEPAVEELLRNPARANFVQEIINAGAIFGGGRGSSILSINPEIINAITFCVQSDVKKVLGAEYQKFELTALSKNEYV